MTGPHRDYTLRQVVFPEIRANEMILPFFAAHVLVYSSQFFLVGLIELEGKGKTDLLNVFHSNPLGSFIIFVLIEAILHRVSPVKERVVVKFGFLWPGDRLPGTGRSVQTLGLFTVIVVDVHRALGTPSDE